jgi:hypothetical protein
MISSVTEERGAPAEARTPESSKQDGEIVRVRAADVTTRVWTKEVPALYATNTVVVEHCKLSRLQELLPFIIKCLSPRAA